MHDGIFHFILLLQHSQDQLACFSLKQEPVYHSSLKQDVKL
jgi:hypothetical protein